MIEFKPWPKTPRLFKDMVVTEKIDGTNAAILFEEVEGDFNLAAENLPEGAFGSVADLGAGAPDFEGAKLYYVAAQSRKRLIQPGKSTDNAGFAGWVAEHRQELFDLLGPGRHYGEWWGLGIQRGYDQEAKHFSLFNVHRYADLTRGFDDGTTVGVVPTLHTGPFDLRSVRWVLEGLEDNGSKAAPGYMRPEGVVVFHTGGRGDTFKAFVEEKEVRGR